jgi:hypothetical protein
VRRVLHLVRPGAEPPPGAVADGDRVVVYPGAGAGGAGARAGAGVGAGPGAGAGTGAGAEPDPAGLVELVFEVDVVVVW